MKSFLCHLAASHSTEGMGRNDRNEIPAEPRSNCKRKIIALRLKHIPPISSESLTCGFVRVNNIFYLTHMDRGRCNTCLWFLMVSITTFNDLGYNRMLDCPLWETICKAWWGGNYEAGRLSQVWGSLDYIASPHVKRENGEGTIRT